MVRRQYTKLLIVGLISSLIAEQGAQFVPVESCLSLKNIISTAQCQNKSTVSHCVQNDDKKDGWVCTDWKWIPEGKCPYYNTFAMLLDHKDCQPSSGTCADIKYNSTQSQNYSGCYPKTEPTPSTTVTVEKKTTEESEEYRSTTITGRAEESTEECEKSTGNLLVPLVVTSIMAGIAVICFITCTIIIILLYKQKCPSQVIRRLTGILSKKRKHDDQKSSSDAEKEPLTQKTEDIEMVQTSRDIEDGELRPMTESQKSALRQCRVKMVELIDPKKIEDYLKKTNIFSSLALEEILGKSNRLERIRSLLDDLPKRNYLAYSKFLECLKEGGFGYIANEIDKKEKSISNKDRAEHTEADDANTQDKPVRNGSFK